MGFSELGSQRMDGKKVDVQLHKTGTANLHVIGEPHIGELGGFTSGLQTT